MVTFHATARNVQGASFQFTFRNENWNDAQGAADVKLAELVAANPSHRRYGPWVASNIDRCA